jgi:hypothetical protein
MSDRTPTDYALEHAEDMAKTAERLLDAMNAADEARFMLEASNDEIHRQLSQEADDVRSEYRQALRNKIYEFRKRRDRAAPKEKTVYATARNTAAVRKGYEMGGYVKQEAPDPRTVVRTVKVIADQIVDVNNMVEPRTQPMCSGCRTPTCCNAHGCQHTDQGAT